MVALIEEPGSAGSLRRFTLALSAAVTLVIVVIAATPLSHLWFAGVTGLAPPLVAMATGALWISVLMPAASVWQSWFQRVIVHRRRTRGIPEAVLAAVLALGAVLLAGIWWGRVAGLYVGLVGSVIASSTQIGWLWMRSRTARREVEARDAESVPVARTLVERQRGSMPVDLATAAPGNRGGQRWPATPHSPS